MTDHDGRTHVVDVDRRLADRIVAQELAFACGMTRSSISLYLSLSLSLPPPFRRGKITALRPKGGLVLVHHRELDARGGGGGGGGVDFQGLEVERDRLSHVEGDAYRTHVRLSSTAGSRQALRNKGR